MQTFLPYDNFTASASVLDAKRLGKQRVEAFQLYQTLIGDSSAWARHPAAEMWKGHHQALARYMNAVILEWVSRGHVNHMELIKTPTSVEMPWWFGQEKLHSCHRSRLLAKDYEYYCKFGWEEQPGYVNIYPTSTPEEWREYLQRR